MPVPYRLNNEPSPEHKIPLKEDEVNYGDFIIVCFF